MDAGLIFFSSNSPDGKWMDAEISAMIVQMIENGKQIIPILIDPAAPIPPLLKARARRGYDEFDNIVAAINADSGKPPLGSSPPATRIQRFIIRLEKNNSGSITIEASLNQNIIATENAPFKQSLQSSYNQFLQGTLLGARNLSGEEQRTARERILETLGRELGSVVFYGQTGAQLGKLLKEIKVGELVDLVFESTDPELLSLPFEAARLPDGSLPALYPGVAIRRSAPGIKSSPWRPAPGPLKILVAIGAPDEGKTQSAVLDLEQEL